jgi:hypothetical protein
VQPVLQRGLVHRRDRTQDVVGEFPAQHRPQLSDLLGRPELVQPGHERILQGVGDGHRGERARQHVLLSLRAQERRGQQHLGQLLDIERHPIRLGDDVGDDLGRQCLAACPVGDQGLDLRPLQPVEGDGRHVRAAGPGQLELGPEREHVEHGHRRSLIEHQPQHFKRRRIRPVQVLPRRQHGVPLGLPQEPGHERVEGALLVLRRRQVEGGVALLRDRDGEQRGEQRHRFLERQAGSPEPLLQLVQLDRGRILSPELQQVHEVRHHRVEGDVPVIGRAAKHDARQPLFLHVGAQHLDHGRLADAPRPAHQHRVPEALLALLPESAQQPQLLPPPHHEGSSRRHGIDLARFRGTQHAVDRHRLRHALERRRPERLQDEGVAHQPTRRLADDHRSVGRQSFEAGRDIDRLPRRQVLAPSVPAHAANHHRSGVDAHAHRQPHALVSRQAGVERRGNGLGDLQTRVHGARGIVFVRLRPAEVDEEPVAQILRDVAAVTVHDLGGGRLVRADDFMQVLGVEPAGEDGRVRKVAEHHGEMAPLRLADVVRHGDGRGANRLCDRRGRLHARGVHGRRDSGPGLGRPNQPLPVLVAGESPEGELLPRLVQECLVAAEDVREDSIGHAALALQIGDEGGQRRVRPRP